MLSITDLVHNIIFVAVLVFNTATSINFIIVSFVSERAPVLKCVFSVLVVLLVVTGTFMNYEMIGKKVSGYIGQHVPDLKRHKLIVNKAYFNPPVNSVHSRTVTAPHGVVLPRNRWFLEENCEHLMQNTSAKVLKKLILFYNRPEWVLTNSMYMFGGCSRDMCELTDNRDLIQQADAVVVHVCLISDPHPPPARPPGQVWVAFGLEPPYYYSGQHDSPAWRGVFNWTMTYRTDSDIFSPYGFLALRPTPPLKNYTQITLNKTRPVAWFVSSCNTQSRRHQYVQQLQNYIDVDVYGRCGTRECPRSKESECLRLLSTTYYFYLSFENSLCRDYVTEKFFKVFNDVNVIPVVRGGADYEQYFPPNTFINTADFHSPQHLATYLKSLMADTETYAEMLKTKDNFVLTRDTVASLCELCKKLHSTDIQQRVYPDLMHWVRTDMCREATDV